MLNRTLKKEAVEKLKRAVHAYEESSKSIEADAINLHNIRTYGVDVINKMEVYVNTLANTPKNFSKAFEQVNVNIASFKALTEISYDEKEMVRLVGSGTAGGVATGVATAALAPTAAMAIATTFGTASTGAAISGLSGAAATNAALAWLGGGAVAAGGGGIAGGNVLLALAGPIGWGIGAASLTAGGIFAHKRNKKNAIKADNERVEVVKATKVLDATSVEIKELKKTTQNLSKNLEQGLLEFISDVNHVDSYTEFSNQERNRLKSLINSTESLSTLFMKEIGE